MSKLLALLIAVALIVPAFALAEDAPPPAPTGKVVKCRAVDPADQTEWAATEAPKLTECLKALKDKVKEAKCAAGVAKVEYLIQSEFKDGKWTKGTKATAKCK
jgi:hypothetical protein